MLLQKIVSTMYLASFIMIILLHLQARTQQSMQNNIYQSFKFNYGLHSLSLILLVVSSCFLSYKFNQSTVDILQINNVVLLSNAISLANIVMMLLTTFMSHIIYRFSDQYFLGYQNRHLLLKHINSCLISAFLIATTNNLILFWGSWCLCSYNVNCILNLYASNLEKKYAVKKEYIYSRISEVSLFLAIALIFLKTGSVSFDTITKISIVSSDSTYIMISCLIAISVVLKSVQIPFHGWILKVVDAPTPISALLHAGIINIGGFLIIKITPLLSEPASIILFCFGMVTTMTCALVSAIQSSIKVRLAWSTCAQIGFMLLECSIGAYHLALIHIISHSLYKGYSFLYSGTQVKECTVKSKMEFKSFPMATLIFSLTLILLLNYLVSGRELYASLLDFSTWIISLALAALFNQLLNQFSTKKLFTYASVVVGIVSAFLVLENIIANYFELSINMELNVKSGVMLSCFYLLYFINMMSNEKKSFISERLYVALSKGLYIDQYMTQILFNKNRTSKVNFI